MVMKNIIHMQTNNQLFLIKQYVKYTKYRENDNVLKQKFPTESKVYTE